MSPGRSFILILLISLISGYIAFGQYISLNGRKFRDENGHEFYPMVMNYAVHLIYNGEEFRSTNELDYIHLSPDQKYGSTPGYDFQNIEDGLERINADFNEIQVLGFNVVRLVIPFEKKQGDNGSYSPGFYFEIRQFNTPWYNDIGMSIDILPPYDVTQNQPLKFLFDQYLAIASLAASNGLKLWLGCGGGGAIFTSEGIDEFTLFLEALGTYISDNDVTNLFCYEFIGEPSMAEIFHSPPGWQYHTKEEICSIANKWNSTLKEADPNHLTTMGGTWLNDPPLWDPNCVNVDFANMHLYLDPRTFEWRNSNYPNGNDPDFLTHCIKRYKDILYLYDQKITKPYIVGETSFPGTNDTTNSYMSYPYAVYGTEEDGLDFLEQTFPWIRNSNASGYQWWQFQDVHWAEIDTSGPTAHLEDIKECYHGLLRFGDPDPVTGYAAYRKPVAWKLQEYAANQYVIDNSTGFGPVSPVVDLDEQYYNPYNHPDTTSFFVQDPIYSSKLYFNTIEGHVKDQVGKPIVGAYIIGSTFVGIDPDLYNDTTKTSDDTTLYVYYTKTDSAGHFVLNAYDYLPKVAGNQSNYKLDSTIQFFNIIAYGANPPYYPDIGVWNPWLTKDSIYTLESVQYLLNQEITDVFIDIGEEEEYQGYSSISTEDIHINGNNLGQGGRVFFEAQNEVLLNPSFTALFGSEVWIRNAPTPIPCELFSFSKLYNAYTSDVPLTHDTGTSEFNIEFHNKQRVTISPNPNHGEFVLHINADSTGCAGCNYTILDMHGKSIVNGTIEGNQINIRLPNPQTGIYLLQVTIHSVTNNLKFIVF